MVSLYFVVEVHLRGLELLHCARERGGELGNPSRGKKAEQTGNQEIHLGENEISSFVSSLVVFGRWEEIPHSDEFV
jgi:hypothetical protein